MNRENALTLLEHLGCRPRARGNKITSRCPFPENHRRGDRRPSFSAKIIDDDWSPYNCFGCPESGTLEQLAIANNMQYLVPGWKPREVNGDWLSSPEKSKKKPERPKTIFFDDRYLRPFMGTLSGEIKRRGVTVETAKKWELGVDRKHRRAIFVVRDYIGRLGVVIGRDIDKENPSSIKYTNYLFDKRMKIFVPWRSYSRQGFKEEEYVSPMKSRFLYGEKEAFARYEFDKPDLVIVEGPMDVLILWQFGFNVVGLLGSSMTQEQASKVLLFTPDNGKVIMMLDGDEAGLRGKESIIRELKMKATIYDAPLGGGMDPAKLSRDQARKIIGEAKFIA